MSLLKTLKGDYDRHVKNENPLGFAALATYRIGNAVKTLPGPLAKIAGKFYGAAHWASETVCGVSIPRDTKIGEDFHLVHAGAVNIHPDCVIGDRVGLMHGVTLGTNMGDAVPTLEDDVFIGCNASVLGGVTIGKGARVAANSLVITNVPPGAYAVGVPAKVIRAKVRKADVPAAQQTGSSE